MNWKEFLKPNKRKIMITFIALFLTSQLFLILILLVAGFYTKFVNQNYSFDFSSTIVCPTKINCYVGLPLYYEKTTSSSIYAGTQKDFLYFNLIIDIFFWYLLSCLIVWIYDKFSKVSKK